MMVESWFVYNYVSFLVLLVVADKSLPFTVFDLLHWALFSFNSQISWAWAGRVRFKLFDLHIAILCRSVVMVAQK